MCYNSESSISTYVYVTFISLILYLYGDKYDKHISLIFFTAVQIQLAEFFMWKDQKCGIVNKLATLAARLLLYSQPLSVFLGSYLFDTMNISNNIMINVSVIYVILCLYSYINYFSNNSKICSLSKNGNLQWHFLNEKNLKSQNIVNYLIVIIYFIIIIFSWLLFKNTSLGIFFSIFLITIFLFYYIQYPKSFQFATLWCYHISFAITIYAIVRFIDYKNNIFI